MVRNRIPTRLVEAFRTRSTAYWIGAVFALALYAGYARYGVLSLEVVLVAVGAAGLFALQFWGHVTTYLDEEAAWEIEAVDKALLFHRGKVTGRIEGADITRIEVSRRDDHIRFIDVSYKGQTTRIRHYQDMERIYRHLLNIAPLHVAYPGAR